MSDLIDRQYAIATAIIGRTREIDGERWIRTSEVRESLKRCPTAQPNTPTDTPTDLISRQAAIDAIHEDADWLAAQGSDWQTERMERDKSILKSLPSAQPERCEDCRNFNKARLLIPQPERKTGKWIIVTDSRGRHAECPYCGEWEYHSNQKFCGECGAEMKGEEE